MDDPSRFALSVSPESRAKLVNEGAFVGPAADGTDTALWRGVAPGSVDVSITFDGAHVLGSPKQISILINPLYMNINPLLSRAAGPALRGATAGAPSVFTVSLVTDSARATHVRGTGGTGLRPASRAGWRSGTST